jgi:hypothetical protein
MDERLSFEGIGGAKFEGLVGVALSLEGEEPPNPFPPHTHAYHSFVTKSS